jgi:hypothetical protein
MASPLVVVLVYKTVPTFAKVALAASILMHLRKHATITYALVLRGLVQLDKFVERMDRRNALLAGRILFSAVRHAPTVVSAGLVKKRKPHV